MAIAHQSWRGEGRGVLARGDATYNKLPDVQLLDKLTISRVVKAWLKAMP